MEATQRLRCPTCACWPHTAARLRAGPTQGAGHLRTGPAPCPSLRPHNRRTQHTMESRLLHLPPAQCVHVLISIAPSLHRHAASTSTPTCRRAAWCRASATRTCSAPPSTTKPSTWCCPATCVPSALLSRSGLAAAAGLACLAVCGSYLPASAAWAAWQCLQHMRMCCLLYCHACICGGTLAYWLKCSIIACSSQLPGTAPRPPLHPPPALLCRPPTAADVAHTAAVPRLPRAAPHPEARRRARVHGALLAGEAVHRLACAVLRDAAACTVERAAVHLHLRVGEAQWAQAALLSMLGGSAFLSCITCS